MKIIKKENGNVLLTDVSGNTVKRFAEGAVLEKKQDSQGEFVRIAYGHQNKHDIYPSTITATQIEPASEVAFSGTAQDLLNLLSTSFFFEVTGGAGYQFDNSLQHDFLINPTISSGGRLPDVFETQPLDLPGNVVLESATIIVTVAGTGVGLVGIYNVDANGVQNKLLGVTASEYDLTIVGEQTISFTSPLELNAGRYAVAFSRNNVGSGPVMRTAASKGLPFGVSGISRLFRSEVSRPYDGTMPDNAPTPIYLTGAATYIKFNIV